MSLSAEHPSPAIAFAVKGVSYFSHMHLVHSAELLLGRCAGGMDAKVRRDHGPFVISSSLTARRQSVGCPGRFFSPIFVATVALGTVDGIALEMKTKALRHRDSAPKSAAAYIGDDSLNCEGRGNAANGRQGG